MSLNGIKQLLFFYLSVELNDIFIKETLWSRKNLKSVAVYNIV